jgi:CDP-glucose 4,6-dehydratase
VWGYREIDPPGGFDPYSASKGATEIVAAAYRRSFFPPERLAQHGVRLATARAGNVIGGGDWAKDRIVVDMVRHLTRGETVPVRSPRAVRPWQHVLEPLSGYLTLAARMLQSDDPRWCDAWNFGPLPGEEIPVGRLVELFLQAWGEGSWADVGDPNQPHEAVVLRLNIDKALHQLGWRPRWNVAEAVRRSAEWYRRYYGAPEANMRAACCEEIDLYGDDAAEPRTARSL